MAYNRGTHTTLNQHTRWASYHQGYSPIYSASYEFGFVFIDEDELIDDEAELDENEDNGETLTLN